MITFAEMPFHQEQIELLKMSFREGRTPHAQLFHGPSGNGKFAVALGYAMLMLCKNPENGSACGKCPSCMQMRKIAHPDLHFCFPSCNLNGKIGSDQFIKEWRENLQKNPYLTMGDWLDFLNAENKMAIISAYDSQLISRTLSQKSFSGGYKIVIIWLPERMNQAAANKLLKNIEEPEENTLILLISESVDNILPTIKSRVQSLFFPPIPSTQIQSYLQREKQVEENQAQVLATMAEGSLEKALSLYNSAGQMDSYGEFFAQWMRYCYTVNMREIIRLSTEMASFGREGARAFLVFCSHSVRQGILAKHQQHIRENLHFKETDFKLENFARIVDPEKAWLMLKEFDRASRDIASNVYARIVFTDLSLRLHYILKKGMVPGLLEEA